MVYSTLKQQKSISISQVLFLVTFWVEYFILPMVIKTFYIFEITRFALYFNFTLYNAYSSHQEIYFYISMLTLKLKSTMWKMNIIVHIHSNWFDDGTHTDTHKWTKLFKVKSTRCIMKKYIHTSVRPGQSVRCKWSQ